MVYLGLIKCMCRHSTLYLLISYNDKTMIIMIIIMIIIIINVVLIYPGTGPQASAFDGLLLFCAGANR